MISWMAADPLDMAIGRPPRLTEFRPVRRNRMEGSQGSSVKKNEDFCDFSVDLIRIAGFMLN
jgi:hypothetical protein